jgi:predicted HicB family RNase H-like nuclease
LSTLAFMRSDHKAELSVLNLRDTPKDLIAKVKAAAALEHASLKEYVTRILNHHVTELEKKGLLPKGKK